MTCNRYVYMNSMNEENVYKFIEIGDMDIVFTSKGTPPRCSEFEISYLQVYIPVQRFIKVFWLELSSTLQNSRNQDCFHLSAIPPKLHNNKENPELSFGDLLISLTVSVTSGFQNDSNPNVILITHNGLFQKLSIFLFDYHKGIAQRWRMVPIQNL